MLNRIHKCNWIKVLACYLILCLLSEIILPSPLLALTGGPSQPEVQSFEPIGTSEMVDPFSGDFTYNIPLIDVGGYPINLSYNGGVGMDEESSWVGLGWNINAGVINRNMRAIPDDFNGDEIVKEFNIKENRSYGVNSSIEIGELFGVNFLNLSFGLGVSYNNYNGVGLDLSIEPSIGASGPNKGEFTAGLGLSASSETGVGISPSISYEKKIKEESKKEDVGCSAKIGLGFNSRAGLQALTFSASYTTKEKQKKVLGSKTGEMVGKRAGFNGGSDISFSTPSYTPQITMPMTNASLSISGTIGLEIFGLHPDLRLSGYYSGQYLLHHSQSIPAYGYLNTEYGASGEKVMLDFNRENDGSFTKHKPNLPITINSYDVYSVAGQGIGGMYRPYRNDIGVLFDTKVQNISGGLDLPAFEVGAGNGFHMGTNFTINAVNSKSGKWEEDNSVQNILKFRGRKPNDPFFEPTYFKQAGEKTVDSDHGFFASIGDYDPVRIKLNSNTEDVPATSNYERYPNGVATTPQVMPITANNTRQKRQRRNESVTTLDAKEASTFGLVKTIQDFGFNHTIDNNDFINVNGVLKCNPDKGQYKPNTSFARTDHRGHHISEITAIRADGARYVYGNPAYNKKQEDVNFSIEGGSPDCQTGLVSYVHGVDNSISNSKGQDNYFSKTTMPPFAHSYLLTAIISPDYVDVTGNGPSDDDLGSYTKFNYTLAVPDFKWRVPFELNKANYNEGLKSLGDLDNKASYVYGEKEIWYLHSIETKTHVAEFEIKDRADGYEVQGDQGGLGSHSMKLLKEIRLYAKPDKIKNQSNATPLKVVHFEYDYSLCTGISNNKNVDQNSGLPGIQDPNNFLNQGGKLTLLKVWFTYQESLKGYLTPYTFEYGQIRRKDGSFFTNFYNPSYNLKGYDRWSNFKENPTNANCDMSIIHDLTNSPLSTAEYSYVDQELINSSNSNYDLTNPNRTMADIYANAWILTTINTPSGGKIKVDFEADDYAYVQDEQAMQMIKVVGAKQGVPQIADTDGSQNALYQGTDPHNYLIIKLPKSYPAGTSDLEFRKHYLINKQGNAIEHLYFRFLVNLQKSSSSVKAFEYVPGYATINADASGLISNGPNEIRFAYVKLNNATIQDKAASNNTDVNPIAQTSWTFAKLYNPRLAYEQSNPSSNAILQIFESLIAVFESIEDFATGYNRSARRDGFSKFFVPEKSWIRLFNPDGFKQGGGYRVKRIVMTDEWTQLTGNSNYINSEYGQEYDYTTVDEYGNTISSGVAVNEPSLGSDENPLKQPVSYTETNLLAPNDDYYMEKPFGECFFPGASVGYSRVTIKNLQYANVTRHATGKVVHEFYTAKDFPVKVRQTPLDPQHKKPNPLLKLLKLKNRDFMTVSQGYSIEVNDMHGKPKSQWVYAENKTEPISGVTYYYEQSGAKQLSNEVFTMNKSGQIKKQTVGVDYDFAVDMREQQTKSMSGGLGGNLDAFLAAILPVAIPVVLPKFSKETTRFRSAVTTKVINRYGLLKETVAYDLGSQVSTKNKLYDDETGEVLLTETVNQYDDPIYNFTYPAHWVYNGMGPSYKNVGMIVSQLQATSTPTAYFVPGDEIINSTSNEKGWVTKTIGGLTILKADGTPFGLNISNKILRSGARNQQSTSIGSVTTLINPLKDSNNDGMPDGLVFNKVLNASSIEFTDQWGLFCNCGVRPGDVFNPYYRGAKGNFRQQRSFLHLTQREQSRLNYNTSIRTDGIYTSFNPFWLPPSSGNIWTPDYNNWTFTSEVTIFDPYGMELENRDALNRYSAALYGYNHSLPIAVSANAQYREIGVDNFEDYDACNCGDDHFSFESQNPVITEKESHTGRRSISLQPGASVEIRKIIFPCNNQTP